MRPLPISPPPRTREPSATPSDDALIHKLVEGTSALVAYWDASLRCRFANRAYQRWYGGSADRSLRGAHIRDVLGPYYRASADHIDAALRGERQAFQRDLPDPDGGPSQPSLIQYVPDLVDGTVRGFFAIATDISALRRAERAMRESEELFRLTVDEAPIGMALVATDGNFVRVNRALCEIVGYTGEELTGRTFQSITHPDDLDADLELLGRLARREIPRYSLEKRYYRKDGTLVDILLSVSAVRAPDGAPQVYIAQIQDVSERKRAERERALLAELGPLLASSLDFEETLTRIAAIVVRDLADYCVVDLVDADGVPKRLRVVSRDPANQWMADVLLRTPISGPGPYLLGEVLETRRPVCLRDVTREQLLSFARNDEHRDALLASDMRSILAVPLVAHARLVGVIGLVSSSPLRRYGPDDVRFAEELAQRAALSIENARLYGEAQRATAARDDVLAIVAHDLRNPLSNILLHSQMLDRYGDDVAKRTHAAAGIERGAQRMNRLIQDLLDVVRIEAGTLRVEPARVAAAQLVNDAVASQCPIAANASLDLKSSMPGGLPDVMADRDRILQTFENLIGNAIKFTTAGGRVIVGAEAHGREVLFSVADSGSGIAAEDVPHVFDRFWQGRRAQRRGAGLGLSIVKGVIEAHGGRIWVTSTPGEGSTFYFTLPVA